MMKMISGAMLGLTAMVWITARHGQHWFELLHGEPRALVSPGASGPGADGAVALPDGLVVPTRASRVQPLVAAGTAAVATPGNAIRVAAPAAELQPWTDFHAQMPPGPVTGDFPWRDCFSRAAAAYRVPEALLLAVARGESDFDASARSGRDAIGVMQIRWPVTAKHLGIQRERELYDPCVNIDAGARYLRELLDRYAGDYHLALAAYNYGPSRVKADHVPTAAGDYSLYIWRHLQAVLGEPASAAARGPAERPSKAGGRMVLLRFNRSWHARAFEEYLRESLPGVQLATEVQARGDHAVYLSWASDTQRRQVLELVAASGLVPVNEASSVTLHPQEKRHAF